MNQWLAYLHALRSKMLFLMPGEKSTSPDQNYKNPSTCICIYIYLRTHICAAKTNMCIYIYITRPWQSLHSLHLWVFQLHTGALMPEPHPMSSNKHGRSGSNSNSSARSVILGLLRDFCIFFPTKRLMLPMGKRLATETRKLCNLEKVRCWKSKNPTCKILHFAKFWVSNC